MAVENNHNIIIRSVIIASLCLLLICAIILSAIFSVSHAVKACSSDNLISIEDVDKLENIDYILVLGAGLKPDGTPSDMLADRLKTSFEVLKNTKNAKLLLSGDNSGSEYNEVASMKKYAIDNGIDESLIVTDDKGFSTYESVERAKLQFNAKKVLIVTQKYHLYRAMYIADQLGLDTYGVSADLNTYKGQFYREFREQIARTKDYFKVKSQNKD